MYNHRIYIEKEMYIPHNFDIRDINLDIRVVICAYIPIKVGLYPGYINLLFEKVGLYLRYKPTIV